MRALKKIMIALAGVAVLLFLLRCVSC